MIASIALLHPVAQCLVIFFGGAVILALVLTFASMGR
jgi:hypothetical protein